MKSLDWEPYYNEFSRISGAQAKNHGLIFRVLPEPYGSSLKIYDDYTGMILQQMPFLDQEAAFLEANKINYNLFVDDTKSESIFHKYKSK